VPIVDVDDEEVAVPVVDRPAVVKQADSRAKDFTGEFDNELVANLFVAILALIVDIDPAPVKCLMWFNSQTIRVPFASITGTTSYLTIGPRDHGMARAITPVQTGYDDPRFGTPGHTWDELSAVITNLPPLLSLMYVPDLARTAWPERPRLQAYSSSTSVCGARGSLPDC
jgi:hypothetical protein